ncbi:uncharacterized protein LOC127009213 isoform X2 [Eriocheir sinensis]|uniref:uncharacterized protein LOC127009213 isoform X2 n=1 Tax=Eriocheir sinensis TaxID=95602 RepID=UPI0021C7387E|nr:uncharacterized protein LOC127009213 isoform X2 [Eriocheir sinensis]
MAARALLAFLLAEQEDADDRARAAIRRFRRSTKTSSRSQKSSTEPEADAACSKPVKAEPPPTKRHKTGVRCAGDYLRKGGMAAFYNLSDFHTHFGMTRTQVECHSCLADCDRGPQASFGRFFLVRWYSHKTGENLNQLCLSLWLQYKCGQMWLKEVITLF